MPLLPANRVVRCILPDPPLRVGDILDAVRIVPCCEMAEGRTGTGSVPEARGKKSTCGRTLAA